MSSVETVLAEVRRVTDEVLIAKLHQLVRADRTLGVRLLTHLGEVDTRRLYREQGYSSMFDYAHRCLRMSEAEAYLRIHAARLGRRFPLVLQHLDSGALHLSGLAQLGQHLTVDNHVQLLQRACGKSKREIAELVAELAPRADISSQMRRLPPSNSRVANPPSVAATSALPASACDATVIGGATGWATLATSAPVVSHPCCSARPGTSPPDSTQQAEVAAVQLRTADAANRLAPSSGQQAAGENSQPAFALSPTQPRAACMPLRPGRYRLQVSVGQETHDALEQLRDLLRHRVPDGDLARIVELAVQDLLQKTLKQRFGQGTAPRKLRSTNAVSPESLVVDQASEIAEAKQAAAAPRPTERAIAEDAATSPVSATGAAGAVHAAAPRSAVARARAEDAAASQAPPVELPGAAAPPLAFERASSEQVVAAPAAATKLARTERAAAAPPAAPAGAMPGPAGEREARFASRYIPRDVARQVYARDGGQCTFVSAQGQRCDARGFLELHHHDTPYARGGEATVANLRLMCRAHNGSLAERELGKRFMLAKLRSKHAARAERPRQQVGTLSGRSDGD